jgi:hypothetical protein
LYYYFSSEKGFATVSADNYVKHWDTSNFDVISSVFLEGNELVCMGIDTTENLTAVGNNRLQFVKFMDFQVHKHIVL